MNLVLPSSYCWAEMRGVRCWASRVLRVSIILEMDHVGLPQCAAIMLTMESASLECRRGADGGRRVSRGHKTGTLRDMEEP